MLDDYTIIPISPDMPEGTDFCIIIDNDLMEPVIKQGQRICVSRHQEPEEFELGVFYYEGRVYCRQFCEDYAGTLHLLCANPLRESENIAIGKDKREKCLGLGRVLLNKKPPRPMYL